MNIVNEYRKICVPGFSSLHLTNFRPEEALKVSFLFYCLDNTVLPIFLDVIQTQHQKIQLAAIIFNIIQHSDTITKKII